MGDKELLGLYWARSERVLTETIVRHGLRCHTAAYRILHSREDREECVNNACLHAWESIPPRWPERFPTFLYKLARNVALHRCERRNPQKRGGGQIPLAIEELRECAGSGGDRTEEDLTIKEALNRFLAGLSQESRIIFLRRYWYFCSVKEIAAACGLSESKVKMSLLRSRKALRQLLEKEGIPP